MSWKLRVLVPALLAAPHAAFALGLGDIRLNSALNEPLSAEIDLVAAAPEESDALRARLASRELFERYGLDRASYLDSVSFKVGKGRDGRTVLLVRSSAPIAEPFVTFLVEVDWPRGKLLREYTVLLDPPVYAPSETAHSAAIAAPRVQSAPAPRPAVVAPDVEPAPAPASPTASDPTAVERPSTYRVQRNDTLFGIASGFTGGERRTTQRMMIALFRGNPTAFSGNINRLQQGATLRVPSDDEVASIGAGEAAAEVGRQTAEWRASIATPESESSHLKLVTPEEGATPAVSAASASNAADAAKVRQLEQQLAETRRLLEVKNGELAALQRKLASAPPAGEPVAAPEPAAETPAEATAAAGSQPAVEPAEQAAQAKPAKPHRKKANKPEVVAAEPSLLDRLTDNWIYLVGAAGVLLAGVFGFGYLRRRREDEFDDAFEAPSGAAFSHSDTQTVRTVGAAQTGDIVVEERGGPAHAQEPAPRHDDTFSSESAVNIDHSDPLAEADFHMAYGLHDQAADLIKLALEKEPQRRDLKNKLLEIYFVWGNKDRFIELARELQATRQGAPAGEWERVVIMGRQIAPEHALFAGTVSSAAMGAMDVNLEGGQTRIDLELLTPPPAEATLDPGIDLDLGRAIGGGSSTADTTESEGLDLDIGAPSSGSTAELPTIEMPRPSDRTAELPTIEMPAPDAVTTAEQPVLDRSGQTIREAFRLPDAELPSADATAELAVDDLGIDLGDLEALGGTADVPEINIEDTSSMLSPLQEADGGTIDLREEATRLAPHMTDGELAATQRVTTAEDEGRTEILPEIKDGDAFDFDLTQIAATSDGSSTAITRMLEPTAEKPELDFDIGEATQISDEAPTSRLDAIAGDGGSTERIDISGMSQLPDLEPVTLSEVGTKLDLARAYMDMGDPDGARSILQEVLTEGSSSQKQEARRLLDALPGTA